MDSRTRSVLISFALLLIVVALGIGFVIWHKSATPSGSSVYATSTATSTLTGTVSSSSATSSGGYTVKTVPVQQMPAAPEYKTPLSYPAGIDASEKANMQTEFAKIQTTLATKPTDWSSWIALGQLRKSVSDYAGAEADFLYVTKLYPNNSIAFANLADLYAGGLHEPQKATQYYKLAISKTPVQESYYENLANVYRYQLNDTTDARATLQEGITAKVSGYQNLQTMLDSLPKQ